MFAEKGSVDKNARMKTRSLGVHLKVLRGPNGTPTPALARRYEDELIREDGQWKIPQLREVAALRM